MNSVRRALAARELWLVLILAAALGQAAAPSPVAALGPAVAVRSATASKRRVSIDQDALGPYDQPRIGGQPGPKP